MPHDLAITDPELTARINTMADDLSRKLPLHRWLVLWRLYDNRPERLGLEEIAVDVSNEARRQFLIAIRDRKMELDAIMAAKAG